MNDTSEKERRATERLICSVFVHLLEIGRMARITTKRMRELLPVTQLRKLEEAGFSQLEMAAESGYTRSWVKSKLNEDLSQGAVHPLERFVSNWDRDPNFPDTLPINGDFPSFSHLVDVYGRDYTAPSLLKMLEKQGAIVVEGKRVVLERDRKIITIAGMDQVVAAQCSVDGLLSTLIHNLKGKQPSRMERRLWGERVPRAKARWLGEQLTQLSEQFRKDAVELISSCEASEDEPGDSLVTVGIGLYLYEQESSENSDESGM